MNAQSLCAQVARQLGEPPALIARRGFQPERRRQKNAGPLLAVVDCVFCGGQILVAPGGGAIEAECRGCDTAFEATPTDVYAVTLRDAERPKPRQRFIDLQ